MSQGFFQQGGPREVAWRDGWRAVFAPRSELIAGGYGVRRVHFFIYPGVAVHHDAGAFPSRTFGPESEHSARTTYLYGCTWIAGHGRVPWARKRIPALPSTEACSDGDTRLKKDLNHPGFRAGSAPVKVGDFSCIEGYYRTTTTVTTPSKARTLLTDLKNGTPVLTT